MMGINIRNLCNSFMVYVVIQFLALVVAHGDQVILQLCLNLLFNVSIQNQS